MSRGKSFTCYEESISLLSFLQIVTVVTVLLLHHHHQTCDAITNTNNQTYCPPSSCGKITNISHPFRLMNDPTSCVNDDPEYVDTAPCINSDSESYLYAFAADFYVEDYEDEDYGYEEPYYRTHHFSVGRLKDYCQVKLVAMSSSDFPNVRVREGVPDRSLSYQEIHGMLLYGFQVSWLSGACKDSCGDTQECYFNHTIGNVECYHPNDDYCIYPLGPDVSKPCDQVPKQFILMEGKYLSLNSLCSFIKSLHVLFSSAFVNKIYY
ncbi:hypothetical protein MtrunA17_Chr1g0158501 [Medicago truncatula]|uniref:Wall-associated receptor kinase galacturonan-binding protein n=1 Tax=Medicago truncatula TaxID=3880 RepID=A0A396JSZ6_MEDTR|nr:hypothetical protein MtrunA17_Chr1g0158501 [Medicago truncatula]